MDSLPFQDVEEFSDINTPEYGDSLRKPELRYTNMSTIKMDPKCKLHIENQCARFARFATFLGNAWPSNLPTQSSKVVQNTVAGIDQIMIEAERAIQEKMVQLRIDVDEFGKVVQEFSDDRWYRNIEDVTACKFEGLGQLLSTMRICDFDDFAHYLKETLPAAAKNPRYAYETGYSFIGKVDTLLDITLRSASHAVSFSLLAVIKARVFVLDRDRIPLRILTKRLPRLDADLLRFLDIHSALDDRDEYWDFASSWRVLVSSWEEMASDAGPLLQVLEPIRKKAEREIRYRTDIAVNRRLPQELADLVFEHAMTVEEVPLEAE